MKTNLALALLVGICISTASCNKTSMADDGSNELINPINLLNIKILVDSSKDGGGWWFPQSAATGFSPAAPHQGRDLAVYLRNFGYTVDELPIGHVINASLLAPYKMVIRGAPFYNYTAAEVAAYDSFLKGNVSLLLISDHMQNTSNDRLSEYLGVQFAGVAYGTITHLNTHTITTGVTSIPFIAGSAVINTNTSNMTILGNLDANEYVDLNKNGIYDNLDIKAPPVMGILQHPTAKIFFLSDVNGLEQLPQPFFNNLIKWLL